MAKTKSLKNLSHQKGEIALTENIVFDIKRKYKLSDKQCQFLKILEDQKTVCMFCNGLAGTAKSYLTIYAGLQLLQKNEMDQVIYVRSPKPTAQDDIGFLPGSEEEKMGGYYEVLYDKMHELLEKKDYAELMKKEYIKTASTAFMRGKSFDKSFVIVDEAQNCSFECIFTLLTRIGENSRIIFLSDVTQKDVKDRESGIEDMIDIFNDEESESKGIFTFEFNNIEDIVRSEFVKYVIQKLAISAES